MAMSIKDLEQEAIQDLANALAPLLKQMIQDEIGSLAAEFDDGITKVLGVIGQPEASLLSDLKVAVSLAQVATGNQINTFASNLSSIGTSITSGVVNAIKSLIP